MLQFLREKTTGWIAIAILILLSIPFAFFGMEQYLFQRNATWVAKVEAPPTWWQGAPSWWPARMLWQAEEISSEEFRSAFDEARMAARQQQGDMFDPRQFESAENKREVLERLVDSRLMAMGALRDGLLVSNAQMREVIAANPDFQVDGVFNQERYVRTLAAGNPPRTPQMFQAFMQERMQQSLLPLSLIQSSFITDSELDRILRLSAETRDIAFFVLPPKADEAPVSDAEAKAWFDSHQADYRLPETVTLDYIEFDQANVTATSTPSESAVRNLYEQQKSRFGAASERLVSHILIEVPANADAAAQKAAEDKASALATQARAPGADFAALARENSADAGSASGGGDLGWISQDGGMVKPFEDAVFNAEVGSIVGPVRTDFGWHVIDVREAKEGSVQPFEAVRDQLLAELAETEGERAYSEAMGRIVDEVLKNPNTLEGAARIGGVEVKSLGPITRDGEVEGEHLPAATELARHPLLLREAFSSALIEDGTVSDPIEIAPGRNVLVRVSNHTAASTRTLEQAREEVIAAVRADRTRKALEADADTLLAEIAGGKTIDAAASTRNEQVMRLPGLPRNAPVPTAEAGKRIFSVRAPAEGKVSTGRASLEDGSVMVFAVEKVTPGDPASASTEERNAVRQQLSQISAIGEIESLRKAMRQRYRVSIEESRL